MLDTPADVIAADKAALYALGGDRSALSGGRAYSDSLATTTGGGASANARSGSQRPASAGAEADEESRFQLLRRATNAAGGGNGGSSSGSGEVAIDPMRLFQSRRAVGGSAATAVEMTSSQRGPTQRKFE